MYGCEVFFDFFNFKSSVNCIAYPPYKDLTSPLESGRSVFFREVIAHVLIACEGGFNRFSFCSLLRLGFRIHGIGVFCIFLFIANFFIVCCGFVNGIAKDEEVAFGAFEVFFFIFQKLKVNFRKLVLFMFQFRYLFFGVIAAITGSPKFSEE